MVASLLKLANLDWTVPDYTTLCLRQRTLAVQVPYRHADGPLKLLVDSTGSHTAEIQIRVALINRFNALRTAEIVRVA